jgi:pSer/pThr/pTyr-binding forkhead associated (FHA) protein
MAKAPVKITKDLAAPVKVGHHYRLICMTGKNKGVAYYLQEDRVIMGRSNKADVQIMDTQASREHVELVKVNENYILTDLGSQNGVMVNDLNVKQHKLKEGDKIIIGSTVYKFGELDVLPVVVEELDEYEEDDDEDEEEKKPKKKKGKDQKNKKVVYLVVFALLALFLMDDEGEKAKKTGQKKKEAGVFLDSGAKKVRRSKLEKEIQLKVKAYIHRGRREAREGNFFRAMDEFKLARMLDPNNGDAAFHMNKAKQRLDEKIASLFADATKSKDALRFHQALGIYCSIYKLLKEYPDDERFKEADKNVKDMADKIGKEESDNHCL